MSKEKIALFIIQLALCIVGFFLINDIKTAIGVLLFLWSNNIQLQAQPKDRE